MPNELRERTLDQIPGYRKAIERSRRLQRLTLQAVNSIGNLGDLNVAYHQQIADAVDNGTTDLTQLRDLYAADVAALQGRAQFHNLAITVQQQARDEAAELLTRHADIALDYLRDELNSLMTEVRKHRTIIDNHPATAEAAIERGTKAAANWKTVTDLLGRYDDIRREHREWLKRQHGDHVHSFHTVGQISRFLEAEPAWLLRRRTTSPPAGGRERDIAAWFNSATGDVNPEDGRRNDIWPHSHRPNKWLLIVADNDPWLPDANTITTAANAADELFKNNDTATTAHWFRSRVTVLTDLGAQLDLTTNSQYATA